MFLKCMLAAAAIVTSAVMEAAPFMTNVYGRDYVLLNGKWSAFTDLYDQGRKMEVYKNRKPQSNEEFYEYSFDGAMRLDVPGDWNSQYPELKYYEGTMWYARHFDAPAPNSFRNQDSEAAAITATGRAFLYFGAVSYRCMVYLNGELIASHEGGFTPFQVEVTGLLKDKDNFLCLEVSNRRTPDAIPAMNFDWWNYGGITRDVMLVSVPQVFVEDYFIRLDKNEPDLIHASVKLSCEVERKVVVEIPELKVRQAIMTDASGCGEVSFRVKKLKRWSPDAPKLYDVSVSGETDRVCEKRGFRNIVAEGERILVNGEPVFMRSVSFHEEIPQRMGRAFSQADASMLLSEAAALGVNMVRLAHYPQNEYTVRLAEQMGILLWEEIPVWQGINFTDEGTRAKAQTMLSEMIYRDRNRCAVGYWGVANETKPSAERNAFLDSLLHTGRSIDATRLYVAAFDLAYFEKSTGHFRHIPNLAGVSPWVLFDFRSPYRFHPSNQDGWNRKGLVSDCGQRKKAWYIMRDWYASISSGE